MAALEADSLFGESVPVYTASSSGNVCHVCERQFDSLGGLKKHFGRMHPGEERPAGWETPSRNGVTRKRTTEHASTPNLREVQAKLESSIGTLGGILAGFLGEYKSFAIMCRATGTQIQIPPLLRRGALKRIPPFTPPYFETTIGHVIAQDAPLSAGIIMKYAEKNETLLRWVERFNSAMSLEGSATVALDHVVGTIHTLKPDHGGANMYMAWQKEDVLRLVSEENEQLRLKIEQLQREAQGVSQS